MILTYVGASFLIALFAAFVAAVAYEAFMFGIAIFRRNRWMFAAAILIGSLGASTEVATTGNIAWAVILFMIYFGCFCGAALFFGWGGCADDRLFF